MDSKNQEEKKIAGIYIRVSTDCRQVCKSKSSRSK